MRGFDLRVCAADSRWKPNREPRRAAAASAGMLRGAEKAGKWDSPSLFPAVLEDLRVVLGACFIIRVDRPRPGRRDVFWRT